MNLKHKFTRKIKKSQLTQSNDELENTYNTYNKYPFILTIEKWANKMAVKVMRGCLFSFIIRERNAN